MYGSTRSPERDALRNLARTYGTARAFRPSPMALWFNDLGSPDGAKGNARSESARAAGRPRAGARGAGAVDFLGVDQEVVFVRQRLTRPRVDGVTPEDDRRLVGRPPVPADQIRSSHTWRLGGVRRCAPRSHRPRHPLALAVPRYLRPSAGRLRHLALG